ncbi:MAG TPA: hypothetical protein VGR22_04430 [Thermomicrobiales bacterium]|nr:hypothetical protein [Thermomicrobiales bacterium]
MASESPHLLDLIHLERRDVLTGGSKPCTRERWKVRLWSEQVDGRLATRTRESGRFRASRLRALRGKRDEREQQRSHHNPSPHEHKCRLSPYLCQREWMIGARSAPCCTASDRPAEDRHLGALAIVSHSTHGSVPWCTLSEWSTSTNG